MKRTTQPDMYSKQVKAAYAALRNKRSSYETFAATISAIWSLRNGTRY